MDTKTGSRPVEWILALSGALICFVVGGDVWQAFSLRQPMWPLPGIYLVEMLLLSCAVAVVVIRDAGIGGTVIWAALGAMVAFAILAAWTIGVLYLPAIVLLAANGILFVRRRGERFPIHLALAAAAALAQGALILAAIRAISP